MGTMLDTEIRLYYNKQLGTSKLENYSFISDYGKLDDFNTNIDEYVVTNIDTKNEYYLLSQSIINNILHHILNLTDNDSIKNFYEIILHNIEYRVNALSIANDLGIVDAEHQLNRLKATVRLLHQDYYKKMNNITVEIEVRKRPVDSLNNISHISNVGFVKRLINEIRNKYYNRRRCTDGNKQ